MRFYTTIAFIGIFATSCVKIEPMPKTASMEVINFQENYNNLYQEVQGQECILLNVVEEKDSFIFYTSENSEDSLLTHNFYKTTSGSLSALPNISIFGLDLYQVRYGSEQDLIHESVIVSDEGNTKIKFDEKLNEFSITAEEGTDFLEQTSYAITSCVQAKRLIPKTTVPLEIFESE
ncbi:MAG: hypothetical protein KC478_06770 [Bacteriovoracaceae bacterium]|nr:hypothetical protein [Bacteriovoracaceae bacterium]